MGRKKQVGRVPGLMHKRTKVKQEAYEKYKKIKKCHLRIKNYLKNDQKSKNTEIFDHSPQPKIQKIKKCLPGIKNH